MRRIPFALLAGLLVLLDLSAFAQTEDDIVLYSQENPAITARGMAMGNAVGVLGADYSGLYTNPAAIGMFRQNDMGFSLGLGLDLRKTQYLNAQHGTLSLFGSFNNFGAVLTLRRANPEKVTGWQAVNFGISYSRINDYTYSTSAQAHNPNDSYADMLAGTANHLGLTSNHLNPTTAYSKYNPRIVVAWGAHIIDEIITDPINKYVTIVSPLGQSETVYQTFNAKQRGDMSEWGFTVGTNISHMLYAGVTVGVPVLSRSLDRIYAEENDTPIRTTDFDRYKIVHRFRESGAGINAKLGLIYSPLTFLRIGAALHTPSLLVINFKEEFSASSNFVGKSPYTAESPKYTGRYTMQTPLRGKASMGILFGRYGMLTADYSFDLYPITRIIYGQDDGAFSDELIPNLRPVQSGNLGLELLAAPFALRLGAGASTSPYPKDLPSASPLPKFFATGGVGFATGLIYFDLAYRYLSDSSMQYIYDFTNDAKVNTRYEASILGKNHQLMASFGFRF